MWQTDAREYHELMAFLNDEINATVLTSLLQEGELLKPDEAIALALTLPGRCLPSSTQSQGELAATR